MSTEYLIISLVVFFLIFSVVYSIWKCAVKIASFLIFLLCIVLTATVLRMFFNEEKVEQMHTQLSNGEIVNVFKDTASMSTTAAKKLLNDNLQQQKSSDKKENAAAPAEMPAQTTGSVEKPAAAETAAPQEDKAG